MKPYLTQAKELFQQRFADSLNRVKPCTEDEVAKLEAERGRLPESYKEYLFWMGRSGGDFWSYEYARYETLHEIDDWARYTLDEFGMLSDFPPSAFVFCWDVSTIFHYFLRGESNDPNVFTFVDPYLAAAIRSSTSLEAARNNHISQRYVVALHENPHSHLIPRNVPFSVFLANEIDVAAIIRDRNRTGSA